MHIDVQIAWLTAVALLAVRLGPLFILAPGLGQASIPVQVRVLMALGLSALLATAHPQWRAAVPEAVVGMAWAFGLFCAFGSFVLAGRLLDLQIGFGVATLFDPATRANSPLLGTALNLMALAIFFALDGHHQIVRAAAASLSTLPPGQGLDRLDPAAVIAAFGSMFVFGLSIVAPALITLMLLDLALGVVARTMPQMNIFIVAMPLKVAVGLLVLALSIGQMGPLVRSIFEQLAGYLRHVVA